MNSASGDWLANFLGTNFYQGLFEDYGSIEDALDAYAERVPIEDVGRTIEELQNLEKCDDDELLSIVNEPLRGGRGAWEFLEAAGARLFVTEAREHLSARYDELVRRKAT